ncbi:MAG: glycosyltransferase [Planctomycetota bacterium]|nr:glycosyltransferase [Planctomycetota bacterium]
MKLIVEISQGLGNCVQGTPLLHALWLMGHEVDLYINSPIADKLKPLWEKWEILGRIFTHHEQLNIKDYDFGVSAYGRRQLVRMLPPGLCLKVEKRHVQRQSETEANVELARWLGYSGPTPRSHVIGHDPNLERPPEHRHKRTAPTGAVVVHAGCDPSNAVKRWPFWPEICRRIADTGRDVIIVGTHDDRSEENWEDEFVSRFHMELPELAALLDVSSLYLGNDSGVGHVAAAVGLPGLMLYGPSNPVKNAPNSSVMRTLVAPGEQGEERDVKAARPVPIERLTVDQVWSEVEKLLANPQREPERELPQRVQDSPEARWEHYVHMTQAQPEVPGVEERGQSPAGTVPKVSVVIPSYNRADNLERAVKSALAQTMTDLEVLVVDDGSTDDTPTRFASPPARVRYIRKPNGGASSARNAGLRRARGEWIALLDSDDEWMPEKLAVQLVAIGEQYVAAASRHVHVNADGSRETKPEILPGRDNHLFRDLYENLSLKTSSLLFKRHLLEKMGLFNERFPISNDWDFFLRLARAVSNSGMRMVEQALLTVHRSPDSISKVGRERALEEAYSRICMVNALLHNHDEQAIRMHVNRAARKHLELSRAYRKAGDKHQAKHHAKEAIRAGLMLKGIWRWLQA